MPGWTQYLAAQPGITSVLAIDPAPLSITPLPAKVRYVPMRAEEALQQQQQG